MSFAKIILTIVKRYFIPDSYDRDNIAVFRKEILRKYLRKKNSFLLVLSVMMLKFHFDTEYVCFQQDFVFIFFSKN